MRYQVKLNDIYYLYDLREEELILESPELDLEINKVGKFNFSIYPDHPYFNHIEKKSSKVEVLKDNKTIFRGRVIEDEQGIYNNKKITCESALAYLNDSIVRPSSFSGTPEGLFSFVINNHNSQVNEEQKIKLGNITVTDPNGYVARSWEEYLSSWELLKTRLLDTLGGYLVERYEDDGTYLDWLSDFTDTSTQVIEFGENLIDILARNDASQTYSVVIPLGTQIENEDGTKSRLTIESVNDGKDYLVNTDALNKYGWIVAPVSETTWDDVTLASNLKTKGQSYLNNQAIMMTSTLEITALDLQATDQSIESFFINEYVRVESKVHNISKTFLLSAIKIPLNNPESTQITLGDTVNTITGIELGNKQNIDSVVTRFGSIERNYILNEQKISEIEKSIELFSVDLSQYSMIIPTDSTKKPLETKSYTINFYGYYKGEQITPTVQVSGTNTGITLTSNNNALTISVNKDTAITNLLNRYGLTFSYEGETLTKVIEVSLAVAGAKGEDANSFSSNLVSKANITSTAPNTVINGFKYTYSLAQEISNYLGLLIDKSIFEVGKIYTLSYKFTVDAGSVTRVGGHSLGFNTLSFVVDDVSSTNPYTSPVLIDQTRKIHTVKTTLEYTGEGTTYLYIQPDRDVSNTNFTVTIYDIKVEEGENATAWNPHVNDLIGPQGIQGVKGVDGVSNYFYVRYSINSNGNPMTAAPSSDSKYMGVASTTSNTAPTSYSAYTWTLIKGSDGAQGPQGAAGAKGADGRSSYLHIKYSNDGVTFTANNGEDVGRFRGELVDYTSTDSTTFSDYKWYDMGLIVEEELEEIRQEVVNNTSLIEQAETQILLDVKEEYVSKGTFDEFTQTTNTQFAVTASGIETKFSEVVSLVENFSEETQQSIRELTSYIRGYQDSTGKPVLELGANTSNITLKIQNEKIQFLQNEVEVAYISDNKLFITDGEFLNSLKIGAFAFIPRTNGSLDFKKVVV